MRFKAKVSNVGLLNRIIQSVEKVHKECVIHLAPKTVKFILTTDVADGVQVFAGVNVNTLFEGYSIESLNNNEIAFTLNLENLIRTLKSAESAQDTNVKLTKKNGIPYLEFNITIQSIHSMNIVQDLPVKLMSAAQLNNYVEPHLGDPEVHIMMPPLRNLRPVVEKMKTLSEHLYLKANMGGVLKVTADSNSITVETTYENLEHPHIEGREPPPADPSIVCEVKVDIKKFVRFLHVYLIAPHNVILCLVKGKAVVLHVLLDDLYLTYYIPEQS